MSDWARGGHATQAANSLADFADFISSAYGPGASIFAQAFDAQLRGTGVDGFKSAAPATFQEWHVGAVWAEIDKSTDVDFSSLTIGRQVYLGASTDAGPIAAAKASWWSKDGAKALRLLTQSAKGRAGGRKFTKDELQGRILSYKECMVIVNSKAWRRFLEAIDRDDLAAAQRCLSKSSKSAKQLRRAFIGIQKAETMQIPEKEPEKAKVYDALIELNRMVAEAIQGKVHSLFPLRKLTTLAFAESVRDALATIDDSAAGVKKTLAMLLGCEQQQLKQQQHANILPALTAVGDVWTIVLGADLAGPYLGRNMASALGIWATVDGSFEAWPAFIEKDSPCPYSLISSILLPRITEWTGALWEALRKGKKMPAAVDMALSEFIEHRLMKSEDDDYNEMCRMAKRIQRGGVKAAAAATQSWLNPGDTGNYVKGGKVRVSPVGAGLDNRAPLDKGCGYCKDVLKLPERNWIGHAENKCNVKKRKMEEQGGGDVKKVKGERLCNFCKKPGHIKKDCPLAKAKAAEKAAAAEAKKAAAAAAKP